MAEKCSTWMKFTIDTEENHSNKKVPMLDFCVWKEGENRIKHEFYEKEVSSKYVTMQRSAISQQ